ncbi:MAG: rhodanese-like domain-containing protein [Desulfobulbaceae bacterium]
MRSALVTLCMVVLVCGSAFAAGEIGAVTAPPQQQGPAAAGARILKSISPVEALQLQQSRSDLIFLDVRTPRERSHGAIPGTNLVSIYDLMKGTVPLPKDKPILLVCAVGGRSYVAAQVMSRQGFQEVYNLSGGISAWVKAGLPLMQDQASSGQLKR